MSEPTVADVTTMINVLAPLDAAGLQAVLRSDGRVLIGPPGKLTDEVRAYIKDHLDHIVADLALRQAYVTAGWREPVHDPRPDLVEDHDRWIQLLTRARSVDYGDGAGAFWSLLGARCMGAELYAATTSWRLRPRKGCEADYAQVKPHLTRIVDRITPLLRSLFAENGGIPAPSNGTTDNAPIEQTNQRDERQ